jgi:hypothetical protein
MFLKQSYCTRNLNLPTLLTSRILRFQQNLIDMAAPSDIKIENLTGTWILVGGTSYILLIY